MTQILTTDCADLSNGFTLECQASLNHLWRDMLECTCVASSDGSVDCSAMDEIHVDQVILDSKIC